MNLSRRNFFQIGAATLAARLSQTSALAACSDDYRALVCVFLFGGNDCNNTLIPISTPTSNPDNSYSSYARARSGLALDQSSLLSISTSQGDTYGLHPALADLANLYTTKRNVAILANTGTLVEPLTRASYLAKSAGAPENLFSHLDQQTAWQTAAPQGFTPTGWGGRLADSMPACHPAKLPMVVSLSGNVIFATGASSNPATVTAGQALGLQGFSSNAASNARLASVRRLLEFDNANDLVHASNSIASLGLEQATILNAALSGSSALKTSFPSSSLGQQLLQIARIIAVRSSLGAQRQVFFASLGGFDTHERELTDQANALLAVSQAINAFYNATVELGLSRNVVTFTQSDFGRTLQPSGGASLGTDHAWGGHHFIVGDAVKGGDLYGRFPTLAPSGPDDANNRGVWIPTTSHDQYGATLARWFGVDDDKLATVFPNLANFSTPAPAFL